MRMGQLSGSSGAFSRPPQLWSGQCRRTDGCPAARRGTSGLTDPFVFSCHNNRPEIRQFQDYHGNIRGRGQIYLFLGILGLDTLIENCLKLQGWERSKKGVVVGASKGPDKNQGARSCCGCKESAPVKASRSSSRWCPMAHWWNIGLGQPLDSQSFSIVLCGFRGLEDWILETFQSS